MEGVDFSQCKIAYFSMEIGIDERMPTYSGGLGVLSGDTLRSAADLDVPIIGITLLYKKGFFRQEIHEGNQVEHDEEWNPHDLLQLLPNRVTVKIDGRDVQLQAWLYTIEGIRGRKNPILLLDSDLEENSEFDRTLTHHLYGGDRYYRLAQELILGIGGVRMLQSIGCTDLAKYHMNEGHSALLTLELCHRFNDLEQVREHCVFTTHTPVAAGHDAFEYDLAMQVLGEMAHAPFCEDIFHEGKLNMTRLALKFSKFVNGVAKRHGQVSREMFPGYQIESITNGVHSTFWASPAMKGLFSKFIPGWENDPSSLRYVLSIPKEELWDAHQEAKKRLIEFVNKKYNAGMDDTTFTIGFARRAATYKRGDLLFSDMKRLRTIAMKSRGIQIIYGGKAHPSDGGGKDIIRQIVEKMKESHVNIKTCYIENYNIGVARTMIPGVDIWLNTPLRPKEASGTSGMKAAINGVPHFSILDGWWIEGHIENNTGWSIGIHPGEQVECDSCADSEDLYEKLEQLIIPRYYNKRDRWIDMMRHSIAINGSFFNTHRMVQQYVLNAYFT